MKLTWGTGSRLLLVEQEVFLGGASVISLTERQTENYINLTIIKTVFCDSHFSTITECCYFHYILCKII